MMIKNQFIKMTKVFALVIFPFILLLLPKNIFNNGNYTICIIKRITGEDCITCGLTRACMHLIHLDVEAAAQFNKISFVILPIIFFLWLRELIKSINNYHKSKATSGEKD